jgi:hypothetical protein
MWIRHREHIVNTCRLQAEQDAPQDTRLLVLIYNRAVSAQPPHIMRRGGIGDDAYARRHQRTSA